jgi:dipeptidase E
MSRLLLLSNSTNHGQGYLDHAMPQVREWLGPVRRLVFVPFALRDHVSYTGTVRERFALEGIEVDGLADDSGPEAVEEAEAVFVGGGNTFRLLDRLQRNALIEPLRRRVASGMPYMGASAGTNLACPTIRTTNDMPIVQPADFQALGVLSFQVNPHYVDPDPGSRHMGETRETRIREYLEENDTPVVGLREGGWIRVDEALALLGGPHSARLFRRGRDPEELPPGGDLGEAVGR